jgi:predicted  nucleic acid-binding Zn-ribbon protein
MQQLNLNALATRLGMAIIEKMMDEHEIEVLQSRLQAAEQEAALVGEELVQANMRIIELEKERGDADGEDREGDGNQGP